MPQLATKFRPENGAFQQAVDAGFACAEFWLNGEFLEQWREVVEEAEACPLKYALHFPNGGKLSDAALDGVAAMYEALDCEACVIHQPMLKKYGKAVLKRCPDIALAVENHRLSPKEFRKWAEKNLWLTLDVEHVWKFTLPNVPLDELVEFIGEFLSQHVAKLKHVHLPGYLPGKKEHRPMSFSPVMAAAILDLLAEHGYDRFAVSEANSEFQTPDCLRGDVEFFENWQQSSLQSTSPTMH